MRLIRKDTGSVLDVSTVIVRANLRFAGGEDPPPPAKIE